MEENVSYTIDKGEISQQKMHLTVINRRPQYPNQSQETARQETERQLFQIFRKYSHV